MAVNSLFMVKLAEELLTDPTKRGYKDKTPEEIVELLNNPYKVRRTIYDEYPARVNAISIGIENAPVGVSKEMIDTLVLLNASQGGN